jgi:hypothetical protein
MLAVLVPDAAFTALGLTYMLYVQLESRGIRGERTPRPG